MGVPTIAARGAAIRQHVQDSPVPIIVDALGYHPATMAKLAAETGTTYSRYAPATRHGHHYPDQPAKPTTVEYASSPVGAPDCSAMQSEVRREGKQGNDQSKLQAAGGQRVSDLPAH
jgi:hypothetical protein